MKWIAFVMMALVCTASCAYAQEAAQGTAPAETTITLKGDIVDNMCADANKATLGDFVKTHTKECATMPACAESGYSIFADGELMKFDKESNAKVAEFLKNPESTLKVEVVAKKVGDELSIVSIANQK